MRSLVKHGADVESMESAANNKITPLMIAAQKGYFQLAKVLIEEMGAVIEKRGNPKFENKRLRFVGNTGDLLSEFKTLRTALHFEYSRRFF